MSKIVHDIRAESDNILESLKVVRSRFESLIPITPRGKSLRLSALRQLRDFRKIMMQTETAFEDVRKETIPRSLLDDILDNFKFKENNDSYNPNPEQGDDYST